MKNDCTPLLLKDTSVTIPYGNGYLYFQIKKGEIIYQINPNEPFISNTKQLEIIESGIKSYSIKKKRINSKTKVAIAINDQTRPIPNETLLPPLLNNLMDQGILKENISIFIATGTHKGLTENGLRRLLPHGIIDDYYVEIHDCDDPDNLNFLGKSSLGTPIFINNAYYLNDIRVVVGQIEPHHFMGFSGGVKSAVIGLGGRKTIEKNHSLITHPKAAMGIFHDNPMRMDIEEIGKIVNIDIAFNVIMNSQKQVVNTFYGNPHQVINEGVKKSIDYYKVQTRDLYDLVIVSPGGYPKDINLYQSQKAITHARSFLKKRGVIILVAECREGLGSNSFKDFLTEKNSLQEVIYEFEQQDFKIGPHKAFLLAKQLQEHPIILLSKIKAELVRKSFMIPVQSMKEAMSISIKILPDNPKVAFLPYATHLF